MSPVTQTEVVETTDPADGTPPLFRGFRDRLRRTRRGPILALLWCLVCLSILVAAAFVLGWFHSGS